MGRAQDSILTIRWRRALDILRRSDQTPTPEPPQFLDCNNKDPSHQRLDLVALDRRETIENKWCLSLDQVFYVVVCTLGRKQKLLMEDKQGKVMAAIFF